MDFTGGLHIDGHVFGGVCAYGPGESRVSVGAGAVVEGGIVATHVTVNGVVRGDVQATGRVALGPNARIYGNVQYQMIETTTGAEITGRLLQAPATAPAATPTPLAAQPAKG